jgi:hypothetical protein
MDQRRAGYVEFLSTTRQVYDAIAGRNWDTVPTGARLVPAMTPDGEQGKVEERLNAAKQAAAVVRIVGPDDLARLAEAIVARIRLDRVDYSPTRDIQLTTRAPRVIEIAEEAGPPEFSAMIQRALGVPLDLDAYKLAHDRHRLDDYWTEFTSKARKVFEP